MYKYLKVFPSYNFVQLVERLLRISLIVRFLIGLVVVIVGASTYFTAKHNFNIFYDMRDVRITYDEQMMPDDEKARRDNEKLKKDKKRGQIVMIVGAVLIVVSFIML